ncbi:DUF499 domain-containing protein [Leptospira bouyouniensis]|uniref:DUF499 domain-containing protein n=1 Tax=Leptospira bouyouniensis TaxID=2484911 RepID=UPI0010915432|nr:DUF499 domain-containing protein [Leptospira bouyouniensis]TGM85091.1 DUF499 domain-containing protein [Leptospira bouyouniensis]
MIRIQESCKPRKTILKDSEQSYALNLTDFAKGLIDPKEFFEENFITEGMDQLIRIAFDRFQRKNDTALIKLTQAMGGGKTHNMITLGLLAKFPEFRNVVAESGIKIEFKDKIRVISFSGRESDAPTGIWGELAKQLGKFDEFAEYYSGLLKAPGETAWINLLQSDEPLLILLDELPPYYEDARSKPIGNSDLSVVTTTAMANLFSAVTKRELGNVLVVISDLKATYEGGSGAVSDSLKNLENESNRISIDLAPVKVNSIEVFRILSKKLFESTGDQKNIEKVAQSYAEEIRKAKQMGITYASPDEFAEQAKLTYPFHPSIKDLYYRFKENPGFQQTRGLIRLMRSLVMSVYSDQRKGEPIYLLSAQHFDFNHSNTFNILNQINSSLNNAISKDIASSGSAVAEELDRLAQNTFHTEVAKLVYFSSLSLVPSAIKGLGESDIVQFIVRPGIDFSGIRQSILPSLRSNCWYMHLDREGKYLFKDTQNLVAKLNSLTSSYRQEDAQKIIEDQLKEIFKVSVGDVYQKMEVFTPWTEIEIQHDKVSLIIKEPFSSSGVPEEVNEFYSEQTFKNRVLILTGEIAGMEALRSSAKNIKAIEYIIKELKEAKVPESDLQFKEAVSLKDTYYANFYSACRETFTKLIFPTKERLSATDISMDFSQNNYNAEGQIRNTLLREKKLEEDIDSDTFRLKCETRLFAGPEMPWTEVKKRAAILPIWQWHKPEALDRLKDRLIRNHIWRENGQFIHKGPHPKENTSVQIQEISRDDSTGAVQLNIRELHGDTIYYDFGADPTPQSRKVTDKSRFESSELEVRFLCIDSNGNHPTGAVVVWKNRITLKKEVIRQNNSTLVTLKAIPKGEIRYSTDGSDPKELGGVYSAPFLVSKKCRVLAIAEANGISSELLSFDIEPGKEEGFVIDKQQTLVYAKRVKLDATEDVYKVLQLMAKYNVILDGVEFTVSKQFNTMEYINTKASRNKKFKAYDLASDIDYIRSKWSLEEQTSVMVKIDELYFAKGEDFISFLAESPLDYEPGDIRQ